MSTDSTRTADKGERIWRLLGIAGGVRVKSGKEQPGWTDGNQCEIGVFGFWGGAVATFRLDLIGEGGKNLPKGKRVEGRSGRFGLMRHRHDAQVMDGAVCHRIIPSASFLPSTCASTAE